MSLNWLPIRARRRRAPDPRTALKANPSSPELWLALARSLSAEGSAEARKAWLRAAALQQLSGEDLVRCCEVLLDLGRVEKAISAGEQLLAEADAGAWPELRERLIAAVVAAGAPASAAGLLQLLLRGAPDRGDLWELLARAQARAGDRRSAAAAWLEADRLQPPSRERVHELAGDLRMLGDLEGLRALVARNPEDPLVLAALGRVLSHDGLFEEAEPVLTRAVEQSPRNINLQGDLDRARHALRRGPAKLKVAVRGNCQSVTLAQALRRLLPEADVVHYHYGFPEDPRRVAEMLARQDLIFAQPGLDPEVQGDRPAPDRTIQFPRFIFAGLHPDLLVDMWITPRQHSRIIAAAFRLGLPEARVPDLFNAYVYGVLGYYDAYAVAEQLLIRSDTGLGLEALLPGWRGDAFMHVPDHPKAYVMHAMAEAACRLARLRPAAAEPGPDWQTLGRVWPVYPEIARRLGVEGSLSFRQHGAAAPQTLEDLVRSSYAAYRTTAAGVPQNPQVEAVATILRREGL